MKVFFWQKVELAWLVLTPLWRCCTWTLTAAGCSLPARTRSSSGARRIGGLMSQWVVVFVDSILFYNYVLIWQVQYISLLLTLQWHFYRELVKTVKTGFISGCCLVSIKQDCVELQQLENFKSEVFFSGCRRACHHHWGGGCPWG